MSMKLSSLVVLCLTVGMASSAFAEEASGVDAFVAEVLARNPTLRARRLTRDAAGRDARAEGLSS